MERVAVLFLGDQGFTLPITAKALPQKRHRVKEVIADRSLVSKKRHRVKEVIADRSLVSKKRHRVKEVIADRSLVSKVKPVKKAFLKYWLPVLFWAGFIFMASSLPVSSIPYLISAQNIIFHIFEYSVLAVLVSRALIFAPWIIYPVTSGKMPAWMISFLNLPESRGQVNPAGRLRQLLLVILICLLYALSDEAHQMFVPGRTSSMFDVIIDSSGILLGAVFYGVGKYLCSKGHKTLS
ncbi:MAG: VanZ family protein [Candidatus Omnitrophota bacterium]